VQIDTNLTLVWIITNALYLSFSLLWSSATLVKHWRKCIACFCLLFFLPWSSTCRLNITFNISTLIWIILSIIHSTPHFHIFSHIVHLLLLLSHLTNLVINFTEIFIKLLVISNLFLALDIIFHFSLPSLCYSLSLHVIATTSHLRRLLDAISL